MTLLRWRDAARKDRSALEQFTCTPPQRRLNRAPWFVPHPKPWELSLQKEIHTLAPGCNARRVVRLGYDETGLAAVTVAEVVDDPSFIVIECVAVALRCRGQGRIFADETMEQAIQWALSTADAASYESVIIVAKTHPDNKAGRELVERHGFGLRANDPDFDVWQQQIVLYP